MAQAIGDPDELERFAQSLTQFIETLHEALDGLNRSFGTLGDTWQDAKRASFEEEYNQLVMQLSHFEAAALEQVPYLYMLASRLRDYLQS